MQNKLIGAILPIEETIKLLSEGNPGALNVLVKIHHSAPIIDRSLILGAQAYYYILDELSIYGPDIWILYKNICQCDISKLLAILRAYQLEKIKSTKITTTISKVKHFGAASFPLTEICQQVKTSIPSFTFL